MFQVWHVQTSKYWCLWCSRQSAHTAQCRQMDAWGRASHHMQHGPLPCRLHELLHWAANLTRFNGRWLCRMPSAFDQHVTLQTCLCIVKKRGSVGTYLCVCACVFPCTKMKKSCSPFYACDTQENCPHCFNLKLLVRKIRSSTVVTEKILAGSCVGFLLESLRPRCYYGADTMKLGFIWHFCFLKNTLWVEMEI